MRPIHDCPVAVPHAQDDPDRAVLSTPPLTAHTGNLRYSGEVHVRFFVARVGGSMPDHPWYCASTFFSGQPPGRRARDDAPWNRERCTGAPGGTASGRATWEG